MDGYPYEWVWMTTDLHGLPHADALADSNPGLTIHANVARAGATFVSYAHAWRNCDRNIRDWWRANRASVTAGAVVFAEFDVLCNVASRSMFRPLENGTGIAGPKVMSRIRDRRTFWPFQEVNRLPLAMRSQAIALAPLAVLMISRVALDLMLDPSFDAVFAADVFCELRLPTVIRSTGLKVIGMALPNVHVTPMRAEDCPAGIYHPVKHQACQISP